MRPTTFVEKAGLKLRCMRSVAEALGLPVVRSLDHDYLVILAQGKGPSAEAGVDAPVHPTNEPLQSSLQHQLRFWYRNRSIGGLCSSNVRYECRKSLFFLTVAI